MASQHRRPQLEHLMRLLQSILGVAPSQKDKASLSFRGSTLSISRIKAMRLSVHLGMLSIFLTWCT